uniref:dynein intermediate chain 3, axonemal-like n=1 Tax=Styela clava TaxID=7725 RepID=UPI00193A9E32|nr:dynein intermediate chain 3, axonemal-like [Styela clava]
MSDSPVPSGAKKGSAKGAKKDAKKPKEEVVSPPPKESGPPEGVMPLFLATKSQQIFSCICDEHVTDDNPYKLIKKEDIIEDMKMRAAISDFHPAKQIVLDYPGEELLVVYDPDFQYGQNFYLCTTEDAKNKLLRPASGKGPVGVAGEEAEPEEEEEIVYTYKPPEAKEWISLGSQVEVECEIVQDTRPKLKFIASRVRREFGAFCEFQDRDVDPATALEQGLSASYMGIASYEDKNFSSKRLEQDSSVQAVPERVEGSSQTVWKHPCTAAVQYEPRSLSKEECTTIENSEEYQTFIESTVPRFELALQQNDIMDVFFDDWSVLGDEDTNFGSKSDNHLKEYQSFTDLQYSKDRTITCIDWHPTIKGVMAVSCAERLSFQERVDQATQLLMTPSLILIWSFSDPIHPQILLEAPDDIFCFKFCPSDPNIVAGGCINGQLVLWDISEHADRLQSSRTGGGNTKIDKKQQPLFGEEVGPETPTIRYCAVSAIENSHKNVITSLEWIPDHFELNRYGIPVENKTSECIQIMTCSPDESILVWDTRPPKTTTGPTREQQAIDKKISETGPQTFKHLDLTWKPLLKMVFQKIDGSGEYSPLVFSLKERQGVRDHVPAPDLSTRRESLVGMGRGNSAKNQKPLDGVSTKYFIATEDGEVVYATFKMEKDSETGKSNVPRPTWAVSPHDGPVHTLQRSPFFSDILLSVGGWTFALWKEGVTNDAILQSACATKLYTAGHWSTTRPAVLFLGTKDGNVEVWDLLDRTHEPSLVQNVTAAQITTIIPWVVSKKQHLIAVSDNIGTLHILEIPWNLRHAAANEVHSVQNYFDRETKRIEYFSDKAVIREAEKNQAGKKKKDDKPAEDKSEEQLLQEYEKQYQQYLELEKKLLKELGIAVEEDEPEM